MVRMLTISQAAQRLGLRPGTIRAWIFRRQHLDFVKVGRSVRIPEDSLERFIEMNTIRILSRSVREGVRQEIARASAGANREGVEGDLH